MNDYFEFLKNYLIISDSEIKYIIELTLKNNILNDKLNKNEYINIFMSKYLENYEILKDKICIKKYNFDELIIKLNQLKNKAHYYFEDIDNNLPYYIPIIDYLQNTSNILL